MGEPVLMVGRVVELKGAELNKVGRWSCKGVAKIDGARWNNRN